MVIELSPRTRRGLIEALRRRQRGFDRCPPFPGELAGASLKHCATNVMVIQEQGGFPRRTRRGLIEAEQIPTQNQRIQAFPGELAGASLKQLSQQDLALRQSVAFPGELAGASLKLALNGEGQSRVMDAFPGELAGASLKHDDDDHPVPDPLAFPGELAGASLKHRAPARARAPGIPFPGELAGASLKPCLDWCMGGGLDIFPRRTRRGLIEAATRSCASPRRS